jgi:hypothetical protein
MVYLHLIPIGGLANRLRAYARPHGSPRGRATLSLTGV